MLDREPGEARHHPSLPDDVTRALYDLADRIGSAREAAGPALFAEAASLGLASLRDNDALATCDAAIGLFSHALPEFGFQIGSPPPLKPGLRARAFALAWRRGEAHAAPYEAATPALALLRAAASEYAKRREAERHAACGNCRGLGWIILHSGDRRLCRHDSRT